MRINRMFSYSNGRPVAVHCWQIYDSKEFGSNQIRPSLRSSEKKVKKKKKQFRFVFPDPALWRLEMTQRLR